MTPKPYKVVGHNTLSTGHTPPRFWKGRLVFRIDGLGWGGGGGGGEVQVLQTLDADRQYLGTKFKDLSQGCA